MSDPVDVIRELIQEGSDGVLEKIACALGYDAAWLAKCAEDARDAARWRELAMHVGARQSGLGGHSFTLRVLDPLPGANLLKGSVLGHLQDAVDDKIRRRNLPRYYDDLTGDDCSVCGEQQFTTPSGVACRNGHGGAPAK